VSHDREFLDNVVTSIFVFEGEGQITEYVGGYADWLRQKSSRLSAEKKAQAAPKPVAKAAKSRKLTNKERAELEGLPALIETLEAEQAELTAKLADPAFYQKDPGAVAGVKARLLESEQAHAAAFDRWAELDALRAASETKR
jgi:ATP-binding cassette subfamily F protein uup